MHPLIFSCYCYIYYLLVLHGSALYIDGHLIEDRLLSVEPKQAICDEDLRKSLVTFLTYYSVHAAPKDDLKAGIQKSYYKMWKEKNDQGGELVCNEHLTVLAFLTSSDVAYTMWQYYINSWEDWKKKKDNGDVSSKYACNTRYTSNRKLPPMELPSDEDGRKMYNKCLSWAKRLKILGMDHQDQDYMTFVKTLNDKVMDLGWIKRCGLPPVSPDAEGGEDEEVHAPVFELEDFDDVPVLVVPV